MSTDPGGLCAFWAARLDDDERYWRVLTGAGHRRAEAMSGKDMADMYGLMVDVMSDPQAREEAERWMDGTVMLPSSAERGLADIEADRAILALYAGTVAAFNASATQPGDSAARMYLDAERELCVLEPVVKIRVARYSGHPGYLAGWKPEAGG